MEVVPRKNSKPVCLICNRKGSVYDHFDIRLFDFVPLWEIAVYLAYHMRRVNCVTCGVKVESVPWAVGKSPVSRPLAMFLAD